MAIAPEPKNLLVVDGDERALRRTHEMLRAHSGAWDMFFARTADEALRVLARHRMDVVVADMYLPERDGLALFDIVRQKYPNSLRIMFCASTERDAILKTPMLLDQTISKHCGPKRFQKAIERAAVVHRRLADPNLAAVVARFEAMSTVHEHYFELQRLLSWPETPLDQVAAVIARDVTLTAKILQVVNSAFFGLPHHIESVRHAVAYLGMRTVRALVLVAGVFSLFTRKQAETFAIHELYAHSIAVGLLAGAIARMAAPEPALADHAVIAGLLYDIAKVLIIANLPEESEAIYLRSDARLPAHLAERDRLGVNHAEVGGYLLGVWGFSDAVVDAASFHHAPSQAAQDRFSVLTAVHVADVLDNEQRRQIAGRAGPTLEQAYLHSIGCSEQVDRWRAAVGAEV
ncbi:MAG: HDOD domain-containing protein [Kiritimatiellae bacterium]|nr:HDOD domain-containing protein [Kiritimatiellia bacterium]